MMCFMRKLKGVTIEYSRVYTWMYYWIKHWIFSVLCGRSAYSKLEKQEMNKNAYDIAIKTHSSQLHENPIFQSAIKGLMHYANITEKEYMDTISKTCELAYMYKMTLEELEAKHTGEYSVYSKYEY